MRELLNVLLAIGLAIVTTMLALIGMAITIKFMGI